MLRSAGRKEIDGDAHVRQDVPEEVLRSSVDGVTRQHSITRAEQREDGGGDGGHAARKDDGLVCAIPLYDLLLEALHVGLDWSVDRG